ncbi:MAG: hypothetical protein GY811_25350 [Myxococcales bacterium]|nr:hypothetical protein [Myxococcales bacterium]
MACGSRRGQFTETMMHYLGPPPTVPVAPAALREKKKTSYGVIVGLSRAEFATSAADLDPKFGVALGAMLALNVCTSFESVVDLGSCCQTPTS